MERNHIHFKTLDFYNVKILFGLLIFCLLISNGWAQEEKDIDIQLTENPYGLSYDGTNFWFADSKRRALIRVDPLGRQEAFNLGIPFISGVTFDSREGRVFVAAKRVILKVEPNTGGVTDRIQVPIDKIGGVASYQNYLYILDSETGKISIYDKGTQTILGGFLTDRAEPRDLCFARDSLWVTDSSDGNIYRYDPANGRITGSVRTPSKDIRGLAIIGSKMYVIDRTSREVKRVSFVETDRFLASGESTYVVQVKITFSLNEPSIVGSSLGLLPPPTTEHQRIRNWKTKDPKFKNDFVLGVRALSKKLSIDDPRGSQTIDYHFEARTTNVRYYIGDDFLKKKEEIPEDLAPFTKQKIPVKEKSGNYFIDKIYDARLFRADWEGLRKALLDNGIPVRPTKTILLTKPEIPALKDTTDAYVPSYGWVPLSTIKPETFESSRAYQKAENLVDLYRSEGWGEIPSPVLFKAKDSDYWKPLPGQIEIKILPKGTELSLQ
ncbi:hypothetical protein CH373_00425 [Leptospira perolatii]|uniref:Uncharacterized protein n=1 Tax=Leptospira perolatii TaxID=2023191 RepID=A0A2M9ZRA5_9LEPT|nr:hypothetical protein [Leptospira perolatii]PJZ71033.1 hypothetical protein CH360_00425 [Leptospira perolatii]PJZ74565.1 hypothetical protein CH373_00425 [Leptospira perolatii]